MDIRVCKGRDAEIKLDPDYIIGRISSKREHAVGMDGIKGKGRAFTEKDAIESVRKELAREVKIYADGKHYMLPDIDRLEYSSLVVDLSMGRALGEISERFYKEGMKEVMSALSRGRRIMKALEGYPVLKEFAHARGMQALGDRLAEMRRNDEAVEQKKTAAFKGIARGLPAVAAARA